MKVGDQGSEGKEMRNREVGKRGEKFEDIRNPWAGAVDSSTFLSLLFLLFLLFLALLFPVAEMRGPCVRVLPGFPTNTRVTLYGVTGCGALYYPAGDND